MEAALEAARAKDTKERLAGVERLHEALEAAARRGLTAAEVTALVDTCMDLTRDANFRIAQGGLQALSAAAVVAGEHFKIHLNALVPAAVERLGDGKQPVRDAARQLLITLMEVLQLMNDSNQSVRDAAITCIEEMYRHMGSQFHEELQRHNLPSYMLKEINYRLDKIEPKVRSSDTALQYKAPESRSVSANPRRGSPRTKSIPRESTLFGGAIDYPSFLMLLKQLVPPLSTQLSDRRSSIVKQACHLLNILSKELLGDFEPCAEQFIPMLFKLVVITVLVIAESADTCIKTILRNCKVARILPRIVDTAKNDRSAILRARCCEYALLVLEYWADAPEIQRSADLYEDMIKCCVADAMSEIINDEDGGVHKSAGVDPPSSRDLPVPLAAPASNVLSLQNSALLDSSLPGIATASSRNGVEDQNLLRRALKIKTPRIEVDLVNYLQSKKERPRPKSYDQADFGTSSDDGYALTSKKSYPFGRLSILQQYFNQILTTVLEVLDDSDSSTRELALSLIAEMLNNQKDAIEDSIEIVLEKLLHVTKDVVAKISNEANQCLNVLLAKYDPFRCLAVIVPLLVSDDEKILVVCINCLTKTVVFCLVDIYIMLGKAFAPYLEGLSSTQLRLVTIYANRISQARSGKPIDSNQ
nr:unnamed protein product [Digitaria exilis]